MSVKTGDVIISVKDLKKYYNGDEIHALDGVSNDIRKGEVVVVIGPSGSGKSTMMYVMSTLKKLTDGDVIYNGRSLNGISDSERQDLRRNEFGFVFQRHYLVSYMTAIENAVIASNKDLKFSREKARDFLLDIGLKESELNKTPKKLSGGQRQRVAIARAMMNDPKVLFADEPTASLDHENAYLVMAKLKDYSKKRLVLVITHDRSIIRDADITVEIWDGSISKVTEGKV